MTAACFLLVHLISAGSGPHGIAYLRRDAISVISTVNGATDPVLARARSFVSLDQRGLWLAETPDALLRAPCVDLDATRPR